MIFTAPANEILKTLDPIIGVAGKEGEATFVFLGDTIETSLTDEAHIAMCNMIVDTFDLDNYERDGEEKITVQMDKLISALKFFGSDSVTIYTSGEEIIIESEMAKRTLRMDGKPSFAKVQNLTYDVNVSVSSNQLKKLRDLETISDGITFFLQNGKLVVGSYSDVETAEYRMEVGVYMDARSTFPAEMLSDIVRRIPADDSVMISLGNDLPIALSFEYKAARYKVYVAPRIETP